MSGATDSAGGFDLLRRATQAMMAGKSVVAEEDGTDHIGFDTPRSGVATPQPDLHDKRLPGIMSYFNQVRPASFRRLLSGTSASTGQVATPPSTAAATPEDQDPRHTACPSQLQAGPRDPASRSDPAVDSPPLLAHDKMMPPPPEKGFGCDNLHPYPTPPASQPPSLRGVKTSCSSSSGDVLLAVPLPSHQRSSSDPPSLQGCRSSSCAAATSLVTPSSVHARHFSIPGSRDALIPSHFTPGGEEGAAKSASVVGQLEKLTRVAGVKSGQNTPTRSLSTAQPPRAEVQEVAHTENGHSIDRAATLTPTPPGAQAPAPKGKLTIKIAEARGLRNARDPYVVAVFQRSELISGRPRPVEEEDDNAAPNVTLGALPMRRQGSDSGRPPMAIPMRSRQSSNTSITDYNTFRSRSGRRSFTQPKWDAEAVFDVVDSNLLVDVSVYDHTASGEQFLGHVDFRANLTGNVRGWFALKGHADTMVENTPTGEIYVEALYQRSDRKHYGPDDFQILRLIGKGTFGQVYQVRKKDTKRIYAMKVLSKKVIVQKKEVAHTVGERNILVRTATSDSPFIVGLKFSFQTPSDLYLVTDYMSGGELFWHLQKEGRFDESRAKFYIAELILAIQHLHNNDIVYRDLKPENILLDANGHIALCDFGLSKANLTKNDTTNTFCGTTEYLAPEVLLDESGYTKMVDFWSLGVLVFEMCCGWSPFYAEDTQQMYKNIAFGKVRFPKDTLSVDGRNFVKGLLNRNPKHRLGATKDAEELKEHGFFRDIDWELLAKKVITPPFKPQLKSETDVSYFDPEFTNALNTNGSLNERAAALARGFATSTPLSPSVQANFQGFTFVDESALEDHMKDRFKYDDEEMDDVERDKEDQDWEDLGDADLQRTNRMSGIVRTTTNEEQMFGGSQFDM